jgi:hypothetical protein
MWPLWHTRCIFQPHDAKPTLVPRLRRRSTCATVPEPPSLHASAPLSAGDARAPRGGHSLDLGRRAGRVQIRYRFLLKLCSNCAIDTPSTPAPPRLAFTRLYASHTSRFETLNDFASAACIIPSSGCANAAAERRRPFGPVPLQNLRPTSSVSVPVPRLGTQALAKAIRLSFSLIIGATGSHVPH